MVIVVYSKITCGFCKKAKDFLNEHDIPFTEFLLNESDTNYIQQRDHYFNKFKWKSFPMITVGNTFIGGYTELVHKYNTTELHDICKEYGLDIPTNF